MSRADVITGDPGTPQGTTPALVATTRVASDLRGARATYEDFNIGDELGELIWSVPNPASVAGLLENDHDWHEWYVLASPWGPPIVPPMATYPPVRILFTRKFNLRGLFYIYQTEFLEPIFYGDRVVITGEIVDKWIKRDREYVMYEARGISENGVTLFRTRRAHALDYLPRTAPRQGEGLDSGIAVTGNDSE